MPPPESAPTPCSPALYVYYRVHQAQAVAARAAIARLFAALQERWPLLRSTLEARADEASAPDLTWMEVHRHPDGVSARCREDIDALARQWLGDLIGARHTEVFVPIDLPAINSLA